MKQKPHVFFNVRYTNLSSYHGNSSKNPKFAEKSMICFIFHTWKNHPSCRFLQGRAQRMATKLLWRSSFLKHCTVSWRFLLAYTPEDQRLAPTAITHLERKMIDSPNLQGNMFHVNLQGCILMTLLCQPTFPRLFFVAWKFCSKNRFRKCWHIV